jgi:hypothetical protein
MNFSNSTTAVRSSWRQWRAVGSSRGGWPVPVLLVGLFMLAGRCRAADTSGSNPRTVASHTWTERIEADWLLEEQLRASTAETGPVSTRQDAAGGCDGIKDGHYGFHTGQARAPWWQVDLGEAQPLARVAVWNRGDAPERAARLRLQLSTDALAWETVYQHTNGVFHGYSDKKPLEIKLANPVARYVRVQLPDESYLHLDEVEVFGPANPSRNLALGRPADQVSVSQWSCHHQTAPVRPKWAERTREILAQCRQLTIELRQAGVKPSGEADPCARVESMLAGQPASLSSDSSQAGAQPPPAYLEARRLRRQLALANPLLDFESILFCKRVPPSFNHMSDQYYGWWSKPGGGLYLLSRWRSGQPREQCLTGSFVHPGSFLRPTLSYDGRKVLFAWCRHYPWLAGETNKLDKTRVPEDAFYHLFEMNLDGHSLRQLTRGKYDDFDGRYLGDDRIVFLSTRRGQSLQAGRESAGRTLQQAELPDCYVRCGGGPDRPVAVYTLHTMKDDGTELCAISPFEMFEWTPEVGRDGSILYSRWDYIDRDNMPYMGLWTMNPDGSNARLVYKNYSHAPHCTFEPKPIPGSHKLVFTASAHHAQTMGSLVLLDPAAGLEGAAPITRLTPEVAFPEIEGWPQTSYAGPWPLSERQHLVAWGCEGRRVPGPAGWDRWHAVQRPTNGMALYYFDAVAGRELIWADPDIGCGDPIPVRPRERPPVLSSGLTWDGPKEGRFLCTDVTRGLRTVKPGDIKALRLVAVPPKTHPTMNFPDLGVTHDDPGKCVLGTVPVEADGSAYFRVPAGVILFFQALDAQGMAVQTMRSATHVQPGQTLSCIGCHESRQQAPPPRIAAAALREPSKITAGPEGAWAFRFDRLVQPVLDRHCVSCHSPASKDVKAARFDLTPAKSYEALVSFGRPSLRDQVWQGYRRGNSLEGDGLARRSAALALLTQPGGHEGLKLEGESLERLIIWMDTYAQKAGVFSPEQEQSLEALRKANASLFLERRPAAGRAIQIRASQAF